MSMQQQQQQLQLQMMQQQQQQQQQMMMMSPALSSPSAGFLSSRASPLFAATADQPDPVSSTLESYARSQAAAAAGTTSSTITTEEQEAPPKQLANALEGLSRAIRLIADVRSGADLLVEALDTADGLRLKDGSKPTQSVSRAVEATKSGLEYLRSIGRELEAAGVLIGAQQRYQDNQPWGLHMPLVCPDGAVVAYSWKRQIAGQAAASAVDRTRLALKSFSEQKKRFLPHIGDGDDYGDTVLKRARSKSDLDGSELAPSVSLSDVLKQIQNDAPGMSVTPHLRTEWPKGSGPLPLKDRSVQQEDGAILEVVVPGILRAIVSLLPAGSATPDAVAVFSPDESGGHVDAWGASTHKVYQRISECGTNALHFFVRVHQASPLMLLLKWLFCYRSLFTKTCRQCRRLLALDPSSNLLLPPTIRPFRRFQLTSASKVDEEVAAYHSACAPKDAS